MTNLRTLRNIIALFIILSFSAGTKLGFRIRVFTGVIKRYTSEDKKDIAIVVVDIGEH